MGASGGRLYCPEGQCASRAAGLPYARPMTAVFDFSPAAIAQLARADAAGPWPKTWGTAT